MAKGGRWSDLSPVEVCVMQNAEAVLEIIRDAHPLSILSRWLACRATDAMVNLGDHWRAVCFESCKHGSAGGGWKRTQPVSCHCDRVTGSRTPAQAVPRQPPTRLELQSQWVWPTAAGNDAETRIPVSRGCALRLRDLPAGHTLQWAGARDERRP